MSYRSIKEWSIDERPREKLVRWGAHTLSLSELIAILISTGSKERSAIELAKDLLQLADNDVNKLAKFKLDEITKVKGIGEAKAVSIIAAIELSRRRKPQEAGQKITSIADAVDFFRPILRDKNTEEFYVLLLARSNKIIRCEQVGKGGLSEVIVDPKVIFKTALLAEASGIILAHNHPSGNIRPSSADQNLTSKIKKTGEMMDINLLDHVIIAADSYYSFAEEGFL